LVELLCASEGPSAALWVLDWFALIVGMPAVKPGWGLIFQSMEHGVGKDMMLWPILRVLGERNYAAPSVGEITSGFNGFAEKRLVSVTDLERNTRGSTTAHDVYETIKPWTENTSQMVRINDKYLRPYWALNTSGWVITSNAADAMPLAESDRRFFCGDVADEAVGRGAVSAADGLDEGSGLAADRRDAAPAVRAVHAAGSRPVAGSRTDDAREEGDDPGSRGQADSVDARADRGRGMARSDDVSGRARCL